MIKNDWKSFENILKIIITFEKMVKNDLKMIWSVVKTLKMIKNDWK